LNSFLKINDRNINFKIIGPEHQKNSIVIMLHDALGSIPQWGKFPGKISSVLGIPVLVYERFGHGNSDTDFSAKDRNFFNREAEYLNEILKTLNIREEIILIGSSDGGTIALAYAAHYGEKVNSVITISAHTFVEDITVKGVHDTKANSSKLINALKKYHSEKAEKLYYGWCDMWTSEDFKNWNMFEDLKLITCPVLAIQGERDEYGTIEQLNSLKKYVKSDCEIDMIKDAGHFPYQEKENEVLDLIKKFLSDKLA